MANSGPRVDRVIGWGNTLPLIAVALFVSLCAPVDGGAVQVRTSLTVTPSSATLTEGDSLQLKAQVTDDAGNVMDRTITWRSSPPIVAISSSGMLRALRSGRAVVTAFTGGLRAEAAITVTLNRDLPRPMPTRIDPVPRALGGAVDEPRAAGPAVAGANPAMHEPPGYAGLVNRSFSSKASSDRDRGSGNLPTRTGGSEGWDGSEWRERNLTVVSAPDDPLSPGSAMRFTYPVGLPSGNGPGIAQTVGLGSPRELYVRTSIRLGPTYRAGSVANKLYFHRMNGTPRGEPFLALHSNGDGTFRLAANFQGTPDNGFGWFYASAPGNRLARDTWYVIETHLIPNSSQGVADGIFRVWLNGTLVLERTNAQYITSSGATSWGSLHVSPTFGGSGGSNNATFYWDLGHAYVSGHN